MNLDEKRRVLEDAIRQLTAPVAGQYPRPWMTEFRDPATARVFTVGHNQRNAFKTEDVGPHEHYLDCLFNRGEESCRGLYNRIAGYPSPTRTNTDLLVSELKRRGVTDVVETNVICYSTPMSADLRRSMHISGAKQGEEVFRALLTIIKPPVIIAHGSATREKLARLLGINLPEAASSPGRPVRTDVAGMHVFLIRSLAPPQWNQWSRWAHSHLEAVADEVAKLIGPRDMTQG